MTSLNNSGSMQFLRQAVKRCTPGILLAARRAFLLSKLRKTFRTLSVKEAFTKIYTDALWGKSANARDDFFSGSGSYQLHVVATYVSAVDIFLKSLEDKPRVVDLGCGDFSVGSQIRSRCGTYIACDVVESLIERNKDKYRGLDVDFRALDITTDELPDGDVVFIRQVFQHLSNELIMKTLPIIASKYRYLLLTEHVPSLPTFIPNIDKPTGPDTRLANASGVVLTSPPFNLKVKRVDVLCDVLEGDSVIRTHLYELR
jgi:SAM-dependent methyltransferase